MFDKTSSKHSDEKGPPGGLHNDVDLKVPKGKKGKAAGKDKSEKPDAEKSVKGRKDNNGQEAVIQTSVLADRITSLEQLHLKASAAKEALNEAIKSTAEKSGLMASVVRKFVDARVNEKFGDKQREYAQLTLCFDEIGED